MSKIQSVNLNEQPVSEAVVPAVPEPNPTQVEPPAPVGVVEPEVAADIDTDELEGLLLDLKNTKKLNKATPKKRTRKPKVVVVEPPVVEPPVVVPVEVEPVVEPPKPKRKYTRKPDKTSGVVDEPMQPRTPSPVQEEEPVRRTPGNMIEEMQRAERALRYQMRKNRMQTLVGHAF